MSRHRSRHLAPVIALALVAPALATTAQADTPQRQIAPPIYKGAERARLIRRGRRQRFRPQARQQLATELKAMDVNSDAFQKKVSTAPLQVRMDVFNHFAQQQNGTAPTTFKRRLRGMLKQHGKKRVAKPSKTFFEVTNANFDLFKKVMGKNVLWFAVNSSPGHLHTLIHDQNNGGKMHHNVYGEGGSNTNDARITGNMTQYALPVVLTDAQMKRFTAYMNAGLKHHRHFDSSHSVYGFFSRGQKINKIACTNWVTSASIGELPRWAKTIDKRLVKMAAAGQINVPAAVAQKGLHGALAAAGTPEARQQLVTAVLGNQLSKWNKSAVKRMAKQFNKEASAFPNKPADLMMRDALAKTLGLGRSQDPAKWSYDLMMSKKVPVVAILNDSPKAKADMPFNMEIMGTIGPSGWVKKTTTSIWNNGGRDNAGALGVIPDGRSTAVRPQPTPAASAQ